MTPPEPIAIADVDALLGQLQHSTLWAEWRVRCGFGPDWVEGDRTIQFYLDQRPLTANGLHKALQQALIEAVHIPPARSHTVLTGKPKFD